MLSNYVNMWIMKWVQVHDDFVGGEGKKLVMRSEGSRLDASWRNYETRRWFWWLLDGTGVDYKRVAWDLQDLDGTLTTVGECPTFCCDPDDKVWGWGWRLISVRFCRICTMICQLGGAAPPRLDTPDNRRTVSFWKNVVQDLWIFECIQLHEKLPLAAWSHRSWVNSGNCPWERVMA